VPIIDIILFDDTLVLYSSKGDYMKKLSLTLLIIGFLCTGCAIPLPIPSLSSSSSGGHAQGIQTATTVMLTADNYRLLKTNVVGTDWGINLLGIIPIVSPDYTKAISMLYKAGEVSEGKSQAIANVLEQHTSPFFILFSIPRITFRADVVEFTNAARPRE
jgi:hypothetical protein